MIFANKFMIEWHWHLVLHIREESILGPALKVSFFTNCTHSRKEKKKPFDILKRKHTLLTLVIYQKKKKTLVTVITYWSGQLMNKVAVTCVFRLSSDRWSHHL